MVAEGVGAAVVVKGAVVVCATLAVERVVAGPEPDVVAAVVAEPSPDVVAPVVAEPEPDVVAAVVAESVTVIAAVLPELGTVVITAIRRNRSTPTASLFGIVLLHSVL